MPAIKLIGKQQLLLGNQNYFHASSSVISLMLQSKKPCKEYIILRTLQITDVQEAAEALV